VQHAARLKVRELQGFPALSGEDDGDVFRIVGNLLAAKNNPKLPNQLLRSIPLINPPVSVDWSLSIHVSFDFFLYRLLVVKVG
jgi:hypothetical protein